MKSRLFSLICTAFLASCHETRYVTVEEAEAVQESARREYYFDRVEPLLPSETKLIETLDNDSYIVEFEGNVYLCRYMRSFASTPPTLVPFIINK